MTLSRVTLLEAYLDISDGDITCKSAEDYRSLKKNEIGGAGALLWKNLSKLPQFFRR
jgi:glycosyltransferase